MTERSYKFTFTPAPDMLLAKYGVNAALVYGRVRRYCEMEKRLCEASRKTIADWLGVSVSTVRRSLSILVEDGYLVDQTPKRKNRPHIYIFTKKLGEENSDWLKARQEAKEAEYYADLHPDFGKAGNFEEEENTETREAVLWEI